jgi:ABC-2 type transport system ATP-binding protein
MRPILECQKLTKKYGNFFALSNVDLSLERGKIVGLLGPNGSGKTTLIKLANGLLTPTDGHIMINGLEPGPATKKIVSYLPDRSFFNGHMTVNHLLAYYADFYRNFSTERALKMLDALEIDKSKRLNALSKGAQEKVQLVLVMSRDADLYILDEPIGGVDPAARDYILRTILSNYSENATVLISTHLITDIEQVLDHVIFLQNGQISLNASVDEIRTEYGKSVDTLFREVFKC